MKKLLFFITTLFLCVTNLFAQVSIYKTYVNIRMVPDHADWIYQPGENPQISVSVEKSQTPLSNVTLSYELGPEMLAPEKTGTLLLKDGVGTLKMGTMKEPGFRTCKVTVLIDGVTYSNWITVAFAPDNFGMSRKKSQTSCL